MISHRYNFTSSIEPFYLLKFSKFVRRFGLESFLPAYFRFHQKANAVQPSSRQLSSNRPLISNVRRTLRLSRKYKYSAPCRPAYIPTAKRRSPSWLYVAFYFPRLPDCGICCSPPAARHAAPCSIIHTFKKNPRGVFELMCADKVEW